MAAIGAKLVTLAEAAKSYGKVIGKITEVLTKTNKVLEVLPYTEMNMGVKHVEELRVSLPDVYYRKANQAIPSSKSDSEEREFSATHFESKSEMDEMVASRGGKDRIPYNRWKQASGHVQSMALEHASLFFYGSPQDDPRQVAGLNDVFYSSDPNDDETANQVLDAGGSGSDNTSIWLVCMGENGLFGIYPAGTQAGLKRTDRGLQKISALDENGDAGTLWGYEENFEMDHGLVVKDYRQISRLANIDVSDLVAGVGADLIEGMINMTYKVDSLEAGSYFFLCNRTIEAHLHHQALNKVGSGGGLSFDNFAGRRVMKMLDIPILRCDSILSTEDAI